MNNKRWEQAARIEPRAERQEGAAAVFGPGSGIRTTMPWPPPTEPQSADPPPAEPMPATPLSASIGLRPTLPQLAVLQPAVSQPAASQAAVSQLADPEPADPRPTAAVSAGASPKETTAGERTNIGHRHAAADVPEMPRASASPRSSPSTRQQPDLVAAALDEEDTRWQSGVLPPSEEEGYRLHEVWWADGGRPLLRARFRLLSDALRFIWGNRKEACAWVRLKDGRWRAMKEFGNLRERLFASK